MKRTLLLGLAVVGLVIGSSRHVAAHCEVPCGIYADQRRFEEMLEDTDTIAKSIDSIRDLANQMEAGADPLAVNQVARWVATKESHATNTQHIIAQYFMTQRLKPTADGYVKKLTAAHAVMVAAMKCKQAADPATATALKDAILNFHKAYEGK